MVRKQNPGDDEKESRDVTLIVADIIKQADFGRGIVRLDPEIMKQLDLTSGDYLRIYGSRVTHCRVMPSVSMDVGTRYIRMDKIVKGNAGVRTGDKVRVRPVDIGEASKVVLAPQDHMIRVAPDFHTWVKRRLLDFAVTKGDVVLIPIFQRFISLIVVSLTPGTYGKIGPNTIIEVRESPVELARVVLPTITYEDIGGLREEIQRIREMVELPLRHPELFRHLGIDPPKGVLLYGPPGTGKTLLAKAVANESNAHFISISGPEIMSKYYGESEKRLREIFEEAEKNAPSIIFIDELDSIAPNRNEVTGEVERRVVAQLLALMDGLKGRGEVIVIGATNRPEAIDPALRRPGRFDREIEIGVPDREGRKEILLIHTRNMPLADDVDLDRLADITHGFVGADLAALVREAAMAALRRVLPKIDLDAESIPLEVLEELKVTNEDFFEALKLVQPSALREISIEIPNVTWDDVGGLEDVKRELREVIELPLKNPDAFRRMGIDPPRGVLLYGPPGCGKTLIAKAVANESEANFISVKGPELLSKWVGESEKAVRMIFRKARQVTPAIVFIDEIDSLFPKRGVHADSGVSERVVSQMLTEIDGIHPLRDVVVIGATNRPDLIDPALLRPGRLERLVYVGPPDFQSRYQILKVLTRKVPLAKDVDLRSIALMTERYSGADLAALVREAAMAALREDINAERVEPRHFEIAMSRVKPSLTDEILKYFEEIKKTLRAVTIPEERKEETYVY
ncbi:CDC48 family AAA ATPase [Candidatus Korarchaeum cryptofilum]|uniref:AAA family ATPase, CDC48 subfamily n=2 Tax=Candidatus Korarchaeum cryptofilum TaxID=498846 RepID=B1L3C5_KORCO|nr:CDC48 family AAA ATPase [Candidatus Korarchaeum cryptofilum]ACB06954.1 AAA family ATPase, CDC48 subfamily [Candidatus Korarchaeum cryptofilum OPF8]